jgi:hypothetical protein
MILANDGRKLQLARPPPIHPLRGCPSCQTTSCSPCRGGLEAAWSGHTRLHSAPPNPRYLVSVLAGGLEAARSGRARWVTRRGYRPGGKGLSVAALAAAWNQRKTTRRGYRPGSWTFNPFPPGGLEAAWSGRLMVLQLVRPPPIHPLLGLEAAWSGRLGLLQTRPTVWGLGSASISLGLHQTRPCSAAARRKGWRQLRIRDIW